MKAVECDNCGWQITEEEYGDYPECPNCWGDYMTVVEVAKIDNKNK